MTTERRKKGMKPVRPAVNDYSEWGLAVLISDKVIKATKCSALKYYFADKNVGAEKWKSKYDASTAVTQVVTRKLRILHVI